MASETEQYIKHLEDKVENQEDRIQFLEALLEVNAETLTRSINTSSMLLEYLKGMPDQ